MIHSILKTPNPDKPAPNKDTEMRRDYTEILLFFLCESPCLLRESLCNNFSCSKNKKTTHKDYGSHFIPR